MGLFKMKLIFIVLGILNKVKGEGGEKGKRVNDKHGGKSVFLLFKVNSPLSKSATSEFEQIEEVTMCSQELLPNYGGRFTSSRIRLSN